MALIRCMGKVTLPASHTTYAKEKMREIYAHGYDNDWHQEILELDPRRKDGVGEALGWGSDGRLLGKVTPSLTKQEYLEQYRAPHVDLWPELELVRGMLSNDNSKGVVLPPPMDDRLIKRLESIYIGEQLHNLMFAQSVGWHSDNTDGIKQMCAIIPILTHGHHELIVENDSARLKQGHLYLFNQSRGHELRYSGKNYLYECLSRPCVLLSVSFGLLGQNYG